MRWWAILAALCVIGSANGAEKIVIKGSNTFGEELGPRLIREFQKSNPGSDVDLESKGTATGFAALLAGECDIASASRPANEDEVRLARSRGCRLKPYTIGYYGVAVIVNAVNPVHTLTDAQVRDIFTGAIKNWKQVGGIDAPIETAIRDPVSGTYLGFQELAMERRPYDKSARMFKSYAEIAEAVHHDLYGIGYVGMNLARGPGVCAVRINGTEPSALAVEEGRYPYARALWLYTNGRQESAPAMKFIRLVLSRRGQAVMEELGYVRRYERRLWSPTEPW